MPFSPPRAGLILSIVLALLVVRAVAARNDPAPTPVEVWSGGDDGLTQRLRVVLEEAFKASSDFRLSNGKRPGTLLVTIPSNVEWEHVGKRTRVLYTVEFASGNKNLGAHHGSCWEEELRKCAAQIVKRAQISASKIGR